MAVITIGVGRSMILTLAAALTAACLSSAATPAYASLTFIVNSTGDEGEFHLGDERCFTGVRRFGAEMCTLQAAIEQANATIGADKIHFGILAFRDGGVRQLQRGVHDKPRLRPALHRGSGDH
jgi:hypothetical protein